MSTVNKKIADDIVNGKYPEDEAQMIVKYTNAWGGEAYGVTFKGDDQDKYLRPTPFIQNPTIYWRKVK